MADNPKIHVALAEDHPIVRVGVSKFINEFDDMIVDIEANNGKDLIEKISKATEIPDVCVVDINMPEVNGFEAVAEIKKRWPDIGILIFTAHTMELYIIRMVEVGANGYIAKNCNVSELANAIRSIYNAGAYYSDPNIRNLFNAVKNGKIKTPSFTEREIDILKYSCTDMTYAEIATKMGITYRSVEGIRDHLFAKLHVNNRASLVMYAIRFGLVCSEIDNTSSIKHFTSKKK